MDIYADVLEGYVNILASGGNGHKGQDGADGKQGASSSHKVQQLTSADQTN